MKKILIAYFSLSGHTEKMAQFIAEGVRFSGQEAVVKKISEIKHADLAGYDGYIFGSPTHFRDIADPMKTFLFLVKKADLKGRLGGAFGSYSHDGSAAKIIFDTMQYVYGMEPFELGPFNLKDEAGPFIISEAGIDTKIGLKACQDYGRVFGEKLAKA